MASALDDRPPDTTSKVLAVLILVAFVALTVVTDRNDKAWDAVLDQWDALIGE